MPTVCFSMLLSLLTATGCWVNVDRAYAYQVEGRLVDSDSGKPLGQKLILVDFRNPIPVLHPDPSQYRHAMTDRDGKFQLQVSSELSDTREAAPTIETVYVAICIGSDMNAFITQKIQPKLSKSSSINLGDLKVRSDSGEPPTSSLLSNHAASKP